MSIHSQTLLLSVCIIIRVRKACGSLVGKAQNAQSNKGSHTSSVSDVSARTLTNMSVVASLSAS